MVMAGDRVRVRVRDKARDGIQVKARVIKAWVI